YKLRNVHEIYRDFASKIGLCGGIYTGREETNRKTSFPVAQNVDIRPGNRAWRVSVITGRQSSGQQRRRYAETRSIAVAKGSGARRKSRGRRCAPSFPPTGSRAIRASGAAGEHHVDGDGGY